MTWTTHLPLVAALRGIQPGEVLAHIQVLVDVGFDAIEILLNSPGWAQSVQLTARVFDDRALIDVSTVLRPEDADLTVAVGDKLVVTPNTHAPMIHAAAQARFVTCIDYMTATGTLVVLDTGVRTLRIFPASALGLSYVHTLKAVLPAEASVFAADGITPENLADYLAADCAGAGLGNDLYRPGQPAERTTERTHAFATTYRSAQSDHT